MNSDALDALLTLRQQLGRDPSYIELLQALGHAPAGTPVAGVDAPGYPAAPAHGSALLGDVHSDDGLSALLESRDLRESFPELEKARQRLVYEMLYGEHDDGGGLAALLAPPGRRGQAGGPGPGHIRPGPPLAFP